MSMGYLPICREDMKKRGWEQCDFVYVTGDAYVDHPSFGHAIISRILESRGYKVGIIPQPDWKNPESIKILGEPPVSVPSRGVLIWAMMSPASSFLTMCMMVMPCLLYTSRCV